MGGRRKRAPQVAGRRAHPPRAPRRVYGPQRRRTAGLRRPRPPPRLRRLPRRRARPLRPAGCRGARARGGPERIPLHAAGGAVLQAGAGDEPERGRCAARQRAIGGARGRVLDGVRDRRGAGGGGGRAGPHRGRLRAARLRHEVQRAGGGEVPSARGLACAARRGAVGRGLLQARAGRPAGLGEAGQPVRVLAPRGVDRRRSGGGGRGGGGRGGRRGRTAGRRRRLGDSSAPYRWPRTQTRCRGSARCRTR
jgi:hypothetical protein